MVVIKMDWRMFALPQGMEMKTRLDNRIAKWIVEIATIRLPKLRSWANDFALTTRHNWQQRHSRRQFPEKLRILFLLS